MNWSRCDCSEVLVLYTVRFLLVLTPSDGHPQANQLLKRFCVLLIPQSEVIQYNIISPKHIYFQKAPKSSSFSLKYFLTS